MPESIMLNLDIAVFTYEISDDALEAAAGDNRGIFCSCGGCTSKCSQNSK